jgi:hypothetical protein
VRDYPQEIGALGEYEELLMDGIQLFKIRNTQGGFRNDNFIRMGTASRLFLCACQGAINPV